LGDDFVGGVGDLEVDVFVDEGADDFAAAGADFLVELADVDLPPTVNPAAFTVVLLGPEDEFLDGEPAAVVIRLLAAESVADFVDEG